MMFVQLLGFLLFACQIIPNGSYIIHAGSEAKPATLPGGYVSFPDVHAAYKIHKTHTTWNQARDQCLAEGAHLAIADTVDKIVHINSLKDDYWDAGWLHVGIYYSDPTNEWVRVDNGFPVTSIQWAPFVRNPTEGCAAIALSGNQLVDAICNLLREPYVCEIPI